MSSGQITPKDSHSQRQSMRGYDRLGIFVRQTQHENHLVRVSIGQKDFVMLNSDMVAHKRDLLSIQDRQVFLAQTSTETCKDVYDGFVFSFKHDKMFLTRTIPSPKEALCYDEWNPKQARFRVKPHRHFTAGTFRFTGLSAGGRILYMHFDFDLKFAPCCLITYRMPDLKSMKKSAELDGTTDRPSTGALPLSWLLSEIARGESPDTILAFTGHVTASAEIKCRRLALKIQLEVKYSQDLKMDAWHVSFEQLPNDDLIVFPTTRPVVNQSNSTQPQGTQPKAELSITWPKITSSYNPLTETLVRVWTRTWHPAPHRAHKQELDRERAVLSGDSYQTVDESRVAPRGYPPKPDKFLQKPRQNEVLFYEEERTTRVLFEQDRAFRLIELW